MQPLVDEFIAVIQPGEFLGVGQWYDDFTQTDDDTVYELLRSGSKIRHHANA
jgi:predicted phosphoribosyltransferase